MSRLGNISLDAIEELEGVEEMYETVFGFVPNGVRIMARRPGIVQGFLHLRRSVFDPATSEVPLELKGLIGHIASKTAGCRYCQAHAIYGSDRSGTDRARLEAAGATFAEEVHLPDGSHLVMLRDPWGLALQLCKRGQPMLRD